MANAGTRCATCGLPPHHHYTTRTGRGETTDHPFTPAPVAERCAIENNAEAAKDAVRRNTLASEAKREIRPASAHPPVADGGEILTRDEYVERIHECYRGQGMGIATHDVLMHHDAALRAENTELRRQLEELAKRT